MCILYFILYFILSPSGARLRDTQINSMTTLAARSGTFAALVLGLFISACGTQGVRLSETDRSNLAKQPSIQVLHYETALPEIKRGGKLLPPSAFEVRRHAAADPAALIAQSFSRLLGKKQKLKNLRVEPRHLPRPVAKNAGGYREQYRRGLVLELWVEEWSFSPLPANTRTYLMTIGARGRLAHVVDGRVLWSTGHCSVGGSTASNRSMRLAATELTRGTRLRKLLAMARDECARQLMRDFDERSEADKR